MNDREYLNKLRTKQSKITSGKGIPGNLEGNDGDFTIRFVTGKGLFLFYKWAGRWYASRFSIYTPTTHEHAEPVMLPLNKLPKRAGELTSKGGKVYHRLGQTSKHKQVISVDSSNVADVENFIKVKSANTDAVSTASNDTLMVENLDGHARISLRCKPDNQGDAYMSYASFATEGEVIKGWCIGMDSSDQNSFKWLQIPTDGSSAAITPSFSTSDRTRMRLGREGNLTIEGTMTIGDIQETTSDTNKFLVSDNGEIKFVDDDTLIPDILTAGTNCTLSGSTLNVDDAFIVNNADDTMTGTLTIDKNTSGDGAENAIALQIDYDRTIATSGTNSHNDIGIDVNMNVGSLGVSVFRGINIDLVGTTDGTSVLTGMYINTSGGDKNYGLDITSSDAQIFLRHTTDPTGDYGRVKLSDTGDLEIKTVGSGTTDSDLTLDIDGDIELNADGGDITFKDGTASLVNINNTNTKFYYPSDPTSYCQLEVTSNRGAATLSTQDPADSNSGSITMSPEGAFIVDGVVGGVYIKEQTGASGAAAGYGSLRVEGTNPNNLYFTNDAGNDIQITNGAELKEQKYAYETKITNFYTTGTLQSYVPIGGYIIETTGTGGKNEYVGMVAPYNGTIEKFMFRSEIAQNGTLEFDILESSDGTEAPGTTTGVKDTAINIADDTTVEVTFASMTSGTNALVKGRIYAFRVDTPSAPYDTNVTLVFKWDVTS